MASRLQRCAQVVCVSRVGNAGRKQERVFEMLYLGIRGALSHGTSPNRGYPRVRKGFTDRLSGRRQGTPPAPLVRGIN